MIDPREWLPDASDESETARDGFLSTRREIHASVLGLAVGLVVVFSGSWELAALFVFVALGAKLDGLRSAGILEIRREPWYALGAFLLAVGADLALALW
jgi:hypothetical protein